MGLSWQASSTLTYFCEYVFVKANEVLADCLKWKLDLFRTFSMEG